MKVLALVLIGACVVFGERDLDKFVPGRPINHGVPGVVTYGASVGQTRPLPRPSNRNSPTPPPGYQPRPQVQPTPPPGYQPRPQVQPTPPPGYQQRPQVQPTPPPGNVPVQTLPEKLPEEKAAQLPPKHQLLRPFPRPGRPQTLPATLPDGENRPQTLPAAFPEGVQTLPAEAPVRPQTLPAVAPVRPQTLPAVAPVRPQTLPASLTEESGELPPKSELTRPVPRPQESNEEEGFAPLPTGPLVEPKPAPGEVTKPLPRPQGVQTLPARLPEEKTGELPPKSELLKPAPRPPHHQESSDEEGFAPLPTGPQVQPKPAPGELTKPLPRPPRPQGVQTLPARLPEEKTGELPPKSELLRPAPRPQFSEDEEGFAPLPTGPQVQPKPAPGELTKPLPRPPRPQGVQTLPARLPEQKTAELPPKSELLRPAPRPQRPQLQARPSPAELTKPAPRPIRPQLLPGDISQSLGEDESLLREIDPLAFSPGSEDLFEVLPPQLTAVPRDVRFSCEDRYPGMYADQDYDCQVFHWCLPDQRMFSFICGYGTAFNQQFLTCDHQYQVRCDLADQAFEVNLRAWNEEGDFVL